MKTIYMEASRLRRFNSGNDYCREKCLSCMPMLPPPAATTPTWQPSVSNGAKRIPRVPKTMPVSATSGSS